MNALPRQHDDMSFPANRTRRVTTMPTVVMQGRVIPQVRDQVQAAAEASGVTMSYYLEALITELVRERGELPTVPKPGIPSTQQELPIQMAS